MAVSTACYAGWPQFYVLSAEQVSHLMQQKECSAGYGKIPLGTQIQIINRNIPSNEKWYWVYSGDGQCKKLPDQLQYIQLEPTTTVYSGEKMVTYYGHDSENLFNFTFTVPAGQCLDDACPWQCSGFMGHNPPHIIGCAQDMQKHTG